MDTKAEVEDGRDKKTTLVKKCLLCTGDMLHLDTLLQEQWWVLQLLVWGLRGVTRVILANNPLSGVLIMAALFWDSPWQGVLGSVGVLCSTLTAIITGQDRFEVRGGLHGFNGMLVSLLMGVFSSAGDWYWPLLIPACLGSATCVLLFSSLSPLLDRWDLPVAVFPFNLTIVLFLLCNGPQHPYFPRHWAVPPGAEDVNATQLSILQFLQGIPLGVGNIYGCSALGPSLLILGAVLLYSPLLAIHALLGSAIGALAGLSMGVRHSCLYTGLSGFNGALGCMVVGGLFFTFSWRTHLFAIASAFFSAYMDIALSNLLGTVGLPACSWGATIVGTLMMLMTGTLKAYRIPTGQVKSPEQNLRSQNQWEAGSPSDRESTDV
ncbi:urea transporter 1 [Eucyclogobius newberryi]|uniref:urea transporter 1 n=1 Tax=Eucyclogobius newberryi TaxID=166745 RepID=UPI003B5B4F5E